MLKELYTAAMGMQPQQTKLEVTANNLANANTDGFKREGVFQSTLIEAGQNLYNVPGQAEREDAPLGSYTDFTAGAFRQTGNPLDIAIENEGFFQLQDEAGNTYYTRNGHFQLSEEGYISAMDGSRLMGDGGAIAVQTEFLNDPLITKDGKALNLNIRENGEVFINEQFIGAIKVYNVDNPNTLSKSSKQNFIADESTLISEISPDEINLRQGWAEGSNVNIVSEMVEMIKLQRYFEAGSKVIKTNEATIEKSLSLGRFY